MVMGIPIRTRVTQHKNPSRCDYCFVLHYDRFDHLYRDLCVICYNLFCPDNEDDTIPINHNSPYISDYI